MHTGLSKMPSSIWVSLLSGDKEEGAPANLMSQSLYHRLKAHMICRKLHKFNSSHKGKMFLYCERNSVSETGATFFPRCFLVLWFILASKIKPKEEE